MSTTPKGTHQGGRRIATPPNLRVVPSKSPLRFPRRDVTQEELDALIPKGMCSLQCYSRDKEEREEHSKKVFERRLSGIRSFFRCWPFRRN